MNKVKTRGWLGQPSIIKSLKQKFGKRAMKERLFQSPGTPRFTARRIENPDDKVSPNEHGTYSWDTAVFNQAQQTRHLQHSE